MFPAAGVERRVAVRTGVAGREIRLGSYRFFTGPAENGGFVEPTCGPGLGVVVRGHLVTLETRVVELTATEPERDHVYVVVPVCTPRLRIDRFAPERDREPTVRLGVDRRVATGWHGSGFSPTANNGGPADHPTSSSVIDIPSVGIAGMTGIVFYRTEQREAVVDFYTERLGFETWLEQEAGCRILRRENLLLGFCDGEETESDGIVTVVLETETAVNAMYEDLEAIADHPPDVNEEFDIYQFFAEDPDGRAVEVQTFRHEIPDQP